jgi:hypothetical protein
MLRCRRHSKQRFKTGDVRRTTVRATQHIPPPGLDLSQSSHGAQELQDEGDDDAILDAEVLDELIAELSRTRAQVEECHEEDAQPRTPNAAEKTGNDTGGADQETYHL